MMSNVRLASSLPARLWNQSAGRSRVRRSTSACTSMCASTQCGMTSSRPNVTSISLQRALDRRDGFGVARHGVVAQHDVAHGVRPAVEDLPRMSSTSSVGELGWMRAPR